MDGNLEAAIVCTATPESALRTVSELSGECKLRGPECLPWTVSEVSGACKQQSTLRPRATEEPLTSH